MNCERLREEIQARLDERGAAPPLPAEAQAHLGACVACAAYAREIEAVSALLRETPEEEPPAGFAEGVMARLRTETPAAPAPVRRFRPLPLRVAAALAVLGLGGFVTWRTLFLEDSLDRTVARAPAGAADARPLGSEARARRLLEDDRDEEPGAAKPLAGVGYLEAEKKAGVEPSLDRADGVGGGKRDQAPPPAAAPVAAAKSKNEAAPPAPASEAVGLGERIEGKVARASEEAESLRAAAPESLSKLRLAKDEVAPIADGASAPIACVAYSIQVGDAEGAQHVAQFAARYYLAAGDADLLRARLQREVQAKELQVATPPAELRGKDDFAGQPQVLSCVVHPEQFRQFDDVLRGLPGVSVWRGPDVERIEPAPGAAPRSNAEAADREASELERVVQELARTRSRESGLVDRTEGTKGAKVPPLTDSGEPTAAKALHRAGAPGPSTPGPSSPGPAPGPATRPATVPASTWVPVRIYLLRAPASQPASGPKK